TLQASLVLDAKRCVRHGLETLARDLGAAGGTGAVRAVVDPGQRVVDLAQDLLGVLLQRVVDLAVVGDARMVCKLVSAPRRQLAGLVVEAELVLDRRGRGANPALQRQQLCALTVEIDGHLDPRITRRVSRRACGSRAPRARAVP